MSTRPNDPMTERSIKTRYTFRKPQGSGHKRESCCNNFPVSTNSVEPQSLRTNEREGSIARVHAPGLRVHLPKLAHPTSDTVDSHEDDTIQLLARLTSG